MNTRFLEPENDTGGGFFNPQEESIRQKIRAVMAAFETISYICVLDRRARVIRMNDRFAALVGAGSTESTGVSIVPYMKRAGLGRLSVQIWKTLQQNKTFRQELALAESHESPKWFDIHVVPLHDEDGHLAGMVGILLDITERKQVEEGMAYQAYHDMLTGLPNRRSLVERLHSVRLRAERLHEKFAILFVDLDRFKEVNDLYGHRTGDAVLVEVAARIQSLLRRDDTVCRQGGDEFIILLPGIRDHRAAGAVAQKLIDILGSPINIEKTSCRVGASIGISVFPDHDQQVDRLIQLADRALYRAKRAGRGRYAFADDALPMTIPVQASSERRSETLPIPEPCHQCLLHLAVDAGLQGSEIALVVKN